jgi:hypothetical protein
MKGCSALPACFLLAAALAVNAVPVGADPVFQWHDLYDGGAQSDDEGTVAVTDAAGNLVIAGKSADGVDGIDMLIRKLDRETGDTVWTKRIAAVDGNDMAVGGMVWDGAGHLLVGGTREGCYG